MAGEHILIVDDELGIQATLRGVLEDEGYRVSAVGGGTDALRFVADEVPDLTFLDVWMGRPDGLETLAEIKRTRPEAIVVMISGHGTIETAVKATRLGAYDFIEKPLSLEKVLLTVSRALEHARLESENAARHAVPRRDRRHEPQDAGQGAALAGGAGVRAGRRQGHAQGGRAGDRRIQPRSARAHPRGTLPGRPVLPPERDPDRGPVPARAQG